MKNTAPNIKFEYQYRDAGNYKKYNSVIFNNPNNITDLASLEKAIRQHLFDQEYFYPYLVDVPRIHFDDWDPDLDHHWYCFLSLEFTQSPPNDEKARAIEQFVEDLKRYAKKYETGFSFFPQKG